MARFAPTTEDQLAAAAAEGLLEETHVLDIKKEITPGGGANKELARDLASFAVDGGTYILGVDETTTPPSLTPIPLDGLPERIEQVGLARVDSPLPIRTTVIRSVTDPGRGYLVVEIPPSPMAPHMVDGRYWSRNDRTKYPLSDAEVSRLIDRRQRWSQSTTELLNRAIAADPTPLDRRTHAHVFLVGRPIPSRGDMALNIFHGELWEGRLLEKTQEWLRLSRHHPRGFGFAPHLGQATRATRRPAGWAISDYGLLPDRQIDSDQRESGIIELEIDEDGTLRAFCARGSDYRNGGRPRPDDQPHRVLFEVLVVGLTHQLLSVARGLSADAGHLGLWDLGVAVTNMAGTVSWEAVEEFLHAPTAYAGDVYEATTRATLVEIEQRPEAVAERMVGRLCRAFHVDEHPRIKPFLKPPDPASLPGVT